VTSQTPYYAPEFKVTINDEPIPAALRASISRVNYQTGLEGSDRVELVLVNENLRWLDDSLLVLDNKLTLSLGYAPEPVKRVFVGEIVSQSASFPGGGSPTLTVVAQDRMQRLQKGTKTRWLNLPVPLVGNYAIRDPVTVSILSLENGLIPITDLITFTLAVLVEGVRSFVAAGDPDEEQKLIRKQAGESDFDFLTRIAQENGWEMFIDHDGALGGYKLRFMSLMDSLSADLTLKYGRSLIDFNPRISNVGQVVAVSVRIWLPSLKTEFTLTISWDWDRSALELSVSPGFGLPGSVSSTPDALRAARDKADPGPQKVLAQQALQKAEKKLAKSSTKTETTLVGEQVTLASAPRVVMSRLIPTLNQRLTGTGSTIGDPRIRAGIVLQLEGLGEQFGGLYRVTSATHTIDSSGYRTGFEVRKEIWFGSIPLLEQGAVSLGAQGYGLRIPF
jgi:phage protein D